MLTLKSNAATICEAVVNLAGVPCKIYELDLSCQVPNNITLANAVAAGVQLAIDDEFTAGDYTVVVTEIISGSPTGWKGKGYVKMKLVAGIVLKQISLNFENAVVNECYELASGSVVTDYDPNWGGILDLDPKNEKNEDYDISLHQAEVKVNTEITDILTVFNCSSTQRTRLTELLAESATLTAYVQENDEFSDEQKESFRLANVEIETAVNSLFACCISPNARIRAEECANPQTIIANINAKNAVITEAGKNPPNKTCHDTKRGNIWYWMVENWKENFGKGLIINHIIGSKYQEMHIPKLIHLDYAIPESSSKGNNNYGFADIVNMYDGQIFEIKSNTPSEIAKGVEEVERYIEKAIKFCNRTPGTWVKGTDYQPINLPWPFNTKQYLWTKLDKEGVIVYEVRDREPGNKPEDIEPMATVTKKKLDTMIKKMYEHVDEPEKLKEIAVAACIGLSPIVLYALATGGTLGTIASVFETIGSAGTLVVPAAAQAVICTAIVYGSMEVLKSMEN